MTGRLADRGWTDNSPKPKGFGNELITLPTIEQDRSAYIENVLPEAYSDALYRSEIVLEWMKTTGEEPIDFGGGVYGITVSQLVDIPVDVLRKVRYYDGRGRRRRVSEDIANQITIAIKRAHGSG
jgi:hypothetical protein